MPTKTLLQRVNAHVSHTRQARCERSGTVAPRLAEDGSAEQAML